MKAMIGLVLIIAFFMLYFLFFKTNDATIKHNTTTINHTNQSHITKKVSQQNAKTHLIAANPQNKEEIHSYAGSEVDGGINLDENGNVLIDKDLKNLFDYFLIATGELSLAQMRQRLIDYAAINLNSTQMQQLLTIYDKYQSFLASQGELDARMNDELSQLQRLEILSQYRKDFLGEEMANAFFGNDEAYAKFVLNNKNTDEALIEQQQQWLEAQNRATAYQDTVIENRQYAESSDLSEQEIYQNRVQEYGQVAADRLTVLDQQRQQWQETVDDYFNQRQLLENSQNANQNNNGLQQLEANYTALQLKRLHALWRIRHE